MRRVGPILILAGASVAACSLFLDSGEFSSEDDKDSGAGTEGGGSDVISSSETGTNVDSGDAGAGDDFCTRSFASTTHYFPFDLPVQTGWSRFNCEPYASYESFPSAGKPAPSMSVTTDSGVVGGSYAPCVVVRAVGAGRTYRFGFDVKLESTKTFGTVSVGQLNVIVPDLEYSINIFHGLAPSQLEHRFGFNDGGVQFQSDPPFGQATLDWASYRVELVIDPSGTSRYTLCRDGQKIRTQAVDTKLGEASSAEFILGLVYVGQDEASPIDLRFDNAFVEVVP